MRVAVDHGLGDGGDGALGGLAGGGLRGGGLRLLVGEDAVVGEQPHILLLALGHGVAHGHILVALDIDHRELLHEARTILERHEVRGLALDVEQQREGGRVAQVLHLALGRLHGALLGSAGHGEVRGLARALVHEDEADDGVVRRDRAHARVQVDVVVLGDVVVTQVAVGAGGGAHHAHLAEHGVEPAARVQAAPVELLHDQVAGVGAVDPLGAVGQGVVLRLAGAGVHEHHTRDGRALEEAHRLLLHGEDPPGRAVLVELEGLLVEHVGGVLELHVAVDVARQRLALAVEDGLVELDHLGLLGGHVNDDVGRDALGAVDEPLEEVGIHERAHAHGLALVVDLAVDVGNLELAHVLGDGAHGAVAQKHCRVLVDDGDLGVVDLGDILGKVAVLHVEHAGVARGVARDDGPAGHGAHEEGRDDDDRDGRQAVEELGLGLVLDGRHEQRHDGHERDDDDPDPDLLTLEVDGGVEPPVAARKHDEGHDPQDDERAARPGRDGLEGVVELLLEAALRARRRLLARAALARLACVALALLALAGLTLASHRDAEHRPQDAAHIHV